jgi:hypothetical protein
VPVEVTDAIKPGVVSMPHGWGHGKPGTRMSVANSSPGANTNALSPPTFIDEPSGNGALNGIPVTIVDDRARFRPARPETAALMTTAQTNANNPSRQPLVGSASEHSPDRMGGAI